jgi:hypothetical protein
VGSCRKPDDLSRDSKSRDYVTMTSRSIDLECLDAVFTEHNNAVSKVRNGHALKEEVIPAPRFTPKFE